MDSHLGPKCRDLFWKARGAVDAQTFDPLRENRARRHVQPRYLVVGKLARKGKRRQPGAVEYFVGVGVADAAQETRVGQRAFERVIFAGQALRECRAIGVLYVQSAHVELRERRFAADYVQRRAALRARLGERETAS